MDTVVTNLIIGHTLLLAAAMAAVWYLHHARIERPPIGVFNLRDVCFTVVMLTVIPVLYLHLPTVLLGGVLTLLGFAITVQALAPLANRPTRLVAALALCVAEVGLVVSGHAGTPTFHAVNDVALLVLAVGISNTWAQSGIRARDVAVFAVVVAGYDVLATGFSATTLDLAQRLFALPFVPLLGWGSGSDAAYSGLGDLLFIALWPLAAEKAYSAAAGRAAMVVTMSCVAVITVLSLTGVLTGAIPTMVVVGPAIAGHWWWLQRRHPRERTAGEYEAALRHDLRGGRPTADLSAALALLADPRRAGYHAVHDGAVIASGSDLAAVLDAVACRDLDAVPVVVLTEAGHPALVAAVGAPDGLPGVDHDSGEQQ